MWQKEHLCVKPRYLEPQKINVGVRTKEEAGSSQGDRLLGPSLAAVEAQNRPLATGCHHGSVPTWATVPAPAAIRGLKTDLRVLCLALPLFVSFSCFCCCLSYPCFKHPVGHKCFPHVLKSTVLTLLFTFLPNQHPLHPNWQQQALIKKNENILQNICIRSHYEINETLSMLHSLSVPLDQKQISRMGFYSAYAHKTPAGVPTTQRPENFYTWKAIRQQKPSGVGENVRLCQSMWRKQVRNWNRKNGALLFSLMSDNKQSSSTAYGGVQAGRCSKQPRHSLPYGVTNCCFFLLQQRGTQKGSVERRKTEIQNGGKSLIVLMSHFVVANSTNWAWRDYRSFHAIWWCVEHG